MNKCLRCEIQNDWAQMTGRLRTVAASCVFQKDYGVLYTERRLGRRRVTVVKCLEQRLNLRVDEPNKVVDNSV